MGSLAHTGNRTAVIRTVLVSVVEDMLRDRI